MKKEKDNLFFAVGKLDIYDAKGKKLKVIGIFQYKGELAFITKDGIFSNGEKIRKSLKI